MAEKKRFVNPYNFIPFEGNIMINVFPEKQPMRRRVSY